MCFYANISFYVLQMPVLFTILIRRLEFGRGRTMKHLPRASPDLCTPLY